MQRLHLIADVPASGTALTVMQSDWASFLPDPTMLDVTLYFARHVYAARLQHHALELTVQTYKGRALRSVRQRIANVSNGLSDGLIAAIIILTVLDVGLSTPLTPTNFI